MKKEFRIREQYGVFFIEKKVKYTVNYYGKWFGKLTHSEQKERWDTISDPCSINLQNGTCEYINFPNYKDALDYISKINPIYYNV